ncbi:hypothetical protein [Thomasclavelia ramosa]
MSDAPSQVIKQYIENQKYLNGKRGLNLESTLI